MPAASPAMLLWWLAASLSSAVYFHPDVMLDERTDLSRFVRSLHVTTCAAMASLAVAALFPSRIDVALSCAGDAPEALLARLTETHGGHLQDVLSQAEAEADSRDVWPRWADGQARCATPRAAQ